MFKLPDASDRTVTGAGANNAVASSSSPLRGTHEIITASGTAAVTGGTVEVSVGAKDAGGQTVINSVTAGGHTHSVFLPAVTMNFIIKT